MNSDSELAALVVALRTWLEAHGVGESVSGLAAGGMMVTVALLIGALLQAIAHRVIRRYMVPGLRRRALASTTCSTRGASSRGSAGYCRGLWFSWLRRASVSGTSTTKA